MHIERVHLGPRGVVTGDVERVEIVPVGFDARPFGDGKAHLGKDRGDLFRHLTDRVQRALTGGPGRQGHVKPFGAQAFIQRGIGQPGLFRGQCGIDFILQRVQRGAGHLTLVRGHLAQFAHLQRHFTLFADGTHADGFQRVFVSGLGNLAQILCLKIVHDGPLKLGHVLLAGPLHDCKRRNGTLDRISCSGTG